MSREEENKRLLSLLADALDDADDPVDDAEAQAFTRRIGLNVESLAASFRARIAAADADDRAKRFAEAQRTFEAESASYAARPREPRRSLEAQRAELSRLRERIPQGSPASVHFLKFEEATEDEVAEMIKALRHLLGDDEGS